MSYLEELLPEFRKGAKIRCNNWEKDKYIQKKGSLVATDNDFLCSLSASDVFSDRWELYQDSIDWQYIIDNKCLCWFWDGTGNYKDLGILIKVYENKILWRYDCRKGNGDYYQYANCRPVRRDEVAFYEDKKDEKD